ncbi:MAG: polyprenyl synthetase family protein [Deltaproteobacteria bacterium]|nr:polyprenyl synthetase family protein [Deltaproteobacteria bacterium]
MDLVRYLADKVDIINDALAERLVKEGEFPESLHKAMHYSLFAGGKRLRPVLALAACEAVGGGFEAALDAACALECIHTYSLIHDDLPALDNDSLRRGRPTSHIVFGEAVAIMAGDALLTVAFDIMGRAQGADAARVLKALSEIASAAGSTGMIGGQVVDIESEGHSVDFPILEYIHIHKTGKLILASVRSGAIMAGANDAQLACMTRFGEAAGLAFQIADDILDVEGSSEDLGKATGGDAKKGKATYPALIGIVESRRRAAELVERAVEALDGFGERAEPLRAIARYVVSRKK